MLPKSLLLTPLVAALFMVSLPGQAAEYHVVVPAPGKAAPYAAIKLELNPASLPAGIVGESFAGFDFNTALRITGDPDLDMSRVVWSLYSGVTSPGLSLSQDGHLVGTPSDIGESSFQVRAKYKTKATVGTYLVGINDITLALNATLPQAHPKKAYSYSLAAHLAVHGDPTYTPDAVTWALVEGTLPVGLNLTAAGEISGIPTVDGEYPLSVQATYKGRSVSQSLQLHVVWTEIAVQETDGARHWEDGSYAKSCLEYLQPTQPTYRYEGTTGDGIYRIAPNEQPLDVYCDMATDGGGWTLLMKQAKGDGDTLQGDTTYWKNGIVLNDNRSSLNMNDGNFVSAAFSALPTTQFMLQASNEATTQKHTNESSSTALEAFSDTRMSVYRDDIPGKWYPSAPNWSIHTTTYPDGKALTTARFGFNFGEIPYTNGIVKCGARWGWAGNENYLPPVNSNHDACGGLGAWGELYGGGQMLHDKGTWQPATYYLWGK